MFDNLMYGLQVAGVGLLIVFAVLVILIIVVTLFSKVFGLFGNKGKKSEAAPVSQKAPETAPAAAPVEQPEYELVDDLELIAVISAAVAACDASGKLVVRSVRRVAGWKSAARAEQVVRF